MVGKVQLRLTGGPELERALGDLGSKVAGRLGENAVRAGARVVAKRAKQIAPVGETGELKRSIRAFQDTERRAGERTAYAGTRLFYGRFLEFGTRFIPARSFLRAALDESGQEVNTKMAENLSRGIERETAKYKARR